jgi:MFS transporter, DHA1 family, multidrug resistance protein
MGAMRMPETLPMSERKSLAIREVLGAFSSDRNQPADPGLCGGSRRRPKITVRLRVLVGAGVLRNLWLGHYFPLAFAAIARHTRRRLSQCSFAKRQSW